MQISKLRIKNFRSIKDSGDIALTKLFALIGKNNTGKSSILKAIQVLWDQLETRESDFHKNIPEAINISIVLENKKVDPTQTINIDLIVSKENDTKTYFLDGTKTPFTKIKPLLPELLVIPDIRDPNESTTEGSKGTLLKKILKTASKKQDSQTSYEELVEKLKGLKQEEAKEISQLITRKFQNVTEAPYYDISIHPVVEIEKGIKHYSYLGNNIFSDLGKVDILTCGTGLQSMYILTLLEVLADVEKYDDNAILVIEEPEVYLHPEFQRRMFRALRRIAENNQVIYSTHSPIMISEVWATESIRQVTLNGQGETFVNAIKIEEVIDELGIRYEDILNPKLVLFVEGEQDIKFFKKIGIDGPQVKIINSDGLRAIHYYAYIKIITSDYVTNEFRVIADSDGLSQIDRREEVKKQIEGQYAGKINIKSGKLEDKIIVLPRYSIESYFLKKDFLSKAFPAISVGDLDKLIDGYTKKYAVEQMNVQSSKLTIDKFQQFLKPKRIFESDQKSEQEYLAFWSGEVDFLRVRDLIMQQCLKIRSSGGDWFDHILQSVTVEELPQEFLLLRDELVKLMT